jgi:hypothetical protein
VARLKRLAVAADASFAKAQTERGAECIFGFNCLFRCLAYAIKCITMG